MTPPTSYDFCFAEIGALWSVSATNVPYCESLPCGGVMTPPYNGTFAPYITMSIRIEPMRFLML